MSTALPVGLTYTNDGIDSAVWQNTVGGAPNRGMLHTFSAGLLARGAPSVRAIRRGTPGIALTTMMSTNFPALVSDFAARNVKPHALVVHIGENDMQAGESAAFATNFPVAMRDIRRAFPSALILVAMPITTDGVGYPEFASVKSTITSVVESMAGCAVIPATGVTLADTVHADGPGYDVQGNNALDTIDTM